jgi:hypothetical protein
MLRLYQRGGGSSEISIDNPVDPELSRRAKQRATRLLLGWGLTEAADLLTNTPFELWNGTNGFGDEFYVLHAEVPTPRYVELSDLESDAGTRDRFRQIANALAEGDYAVRFIAATLDEGGEPVAVPTPTPTRTSDALERALAEVERALADGRPAVAVDRVHTALHAYLRGVAESAGLVPAADTGIVELFRMLRTAHPGLQAAGPRAAEITRILQAIATIVDALNPLRNRASLAHPPEEALLPDAEAMLVINAVRTLLHYLEKRLGGR